MDDRRRNHVLDTEDRCWFCRIKFTYLSEADRVMLTTRGHCLGFKEIWRPCTIFPGTHCIGRPPRHSECKELPPIQEAMIQWLKEHP